MIRIYTLLITFFFLLTSCSENLPIPYKTTDGLVSGEKYQAQLNPDQRAELAKNRRKELNSLRKWDYYIIKNNPQDALSYYLQVSEKLPDDVIVKKKIAHAYFLQRNWKSAYSYFLQVPIAELKVTEKKELLGSLFFDETQPDRLGEMSKFAFSSEQKEYYKIVDVCYSGVHNCIVAIQGYSGTSQDIKNLQKTILDAEKISSDYQFRNFSVATQFYMHGDFRASEKLAGEILAVRPDYTEVIKLAGFSAYELGKFSQAKSFLLSYLEKNSNDLETIVKLGEITYELGDYITSNLYLNNAITAGFTPKTNLERRLAYNYYLLGDALGMIKVVSYLLQESDVVEDDFAVAISLALGRGENIRALAWAQEGIRRYPDSSIIFPLYLTTLRVNGQVDEALRLIEVSTGSFAQVPVVQLEQGILLYDQKKYGEAQKLLEIVKESDQNADFSLEASSFLDEIKRMQQVWNPENSGSNEENKWWF
jgi:tetratricopeptide (TPR) repeat protein